MISAAAKALAKVGRPRKLGESLLPDIDQLRPISARVGLAVAQQAVTTLPKSPATVMTLSMIHEMEAVRTLLESAIAQVQLKRPRQVHMLH